MLEENSNQNSSNNVESDLPRPPAGRRSSTRPAGPPSSAEVKKFDISSSASEQSASEQSEGSKDPATKKVSPRGRSSARKKTVENASDSQQKSEEVASQDRDDVFDHSEKNSSKRSTKTKPTRTRRTGTAKTRGGEDKTGGGDRDAGENRGSRGVLIEQSIPAHDAVADPVEAAIAAVMAKRDSAGKTDAANEGDVNEKRAPRGRGRSRTNDSRANHRDDEQQNTGETTEGSSQGLAVPDASEDKTKNARGRRRTSRKPVADVEQNNEEQATAVDEEVGAALAEAEKNAGSKRQSNRRKAKASVDSEQDKQATLDNLTKAIAGDSEGAAQQNADDSEKSDSAGDENTENGAAQVESHSDEEETQHRRRRRRGGRRRRRGSDSDSENTESVDDGQDSDEQAEKQENQDSDSGSEVTSGQHHRRRRRRRRGEDIADDDAVVRVREPRRNPNDEVTGIEGSTRLEAKRQRRKEGRAAGRRRAPILTEAEFLARRESVDRKMVIRQRSDYTQIAVLEDGLLVEHYVDRKASTSLIGNIYLGKVQNVLPSMEAAFIDIGRGRNAVLYAGEVNWDAMESDGDSHKIEDSLKSGQTILVQVSKDPIGAKGARLTGHISLPGRYVVYSPDGHLSGISRKLSDKERRRLKNIVTDAISDTAAVIVRTAAEGVTEDDLRHDVERLKAQWEVIEKKVAQGNAPQQLYAEPDLTLRIVRDLFTEDFNELIVEGDGGPEDTYETVRSYVEHVAPALSERLTQWNTDEQGDLFTKHRIDEQISKALERKVFLPSGGSLIIDRTEAMNVIDVNTGKFTGTGGNLEETITKNNLEAAEEIVRQMRLRDLGGMIVVDFIDMVLPANRELLLRRLVECLGRDRTRHQVSEVTSLGLVQMTRKRIGTGLAEAFTEECETCGGRGYVRHDEPVASQAPSDGGERHRKGSKRSHSNK